MGGLVTVAIAQKESLPRGPVPQSELRGGLNEQELGVRYESLNRNGVVLIVTLSPSHT